MNLKQLQKIKDRAQKATPGPWICTQLNLCSVNPPLNLIHAHDKLGWSGEYEFRNEEDAKFIALAREDVPALVAEVERLLEENAKFANSILHDTYDEFVHTAKIADLELENKKLKYIIEQLVSKKMYKEIIDFVEGRLKESPF